MFTSFCSIVEQPAQLILSTPYGSLGHIKLQIDAQHLRKVDRMTLLRLTQRVTVVPTAGIHSY